MKVIGPLMVCVLVLFGIVALFDLFTREIPEQLSREKVVPQRVESTCYMVIDGVRYACDEQEPGGWVDNHIP